VTLTALLDAAAAHAPRRTFLAERDGRGVWRELTYARAAELSFRIGAGLRALGASRSRPLLILSENGIDHALATLGAYRAGVPVVPLAPAAGRSAGDDYARLRELAAKVRPAAAFAADFAAYAGAARALGPEVRFVAVDPPRGPGCIAFEALAMRAPLHAPDVPGETIARITFASRAYGETRGVVRTHAMLCAALESLTQLWPFLEDEPPVVVDRLPWSRALGGETVFGIVLRHAGTLYVEQPPRGEADEARGARLRAEVAPTLAFDVPLGWTHWVERLRGDDLLRERWLTRLRLACWSGAPLAHATRDRLRALGVPLAALWGTTETSMTTTVTRETAPPADAIGTPAPGVELKLVPHGDAFDARVRGPQVTSGYWWRADLAASAFDEEGYYRTGDLVRPLDPRAPQDGLQLAGRADDRFKLASGTWVRAAEIRDRFLKACPDAADAIVTGDGREWVGMLVWPREGAAPDDRTLRTAVEDAALTLSRAEPAFPRIARILVVSAPLAADERNADGSPDRTRVVDRRARSLARLYASEPDADVIVP